jgi:hypothetical protein
MARWTVDSLIDQGPDFLRDFVRQPHAADEFAPEFSWLLLADSVGFETGLRRDTNPNAVPRWAEVAAILYEGLIRGSRPQDDLARDIWARRAARYWALAAASPPTMANASSTSPEPHPI